MRLPEFYVRGVELLQEKVAADGLVGVSRTPNYKGSLVVPIQEIRN